MYLLARYIMRKASKQAGKVVDIGCGSGYKLVNYISGEFETIGVETEPAISHLRKSYPNEVWIDSGEPSVQGPDET